MKKAEREKKEKVMKEIEKAGDSENYETSWDKNGKMFSKKKSNIKRGQKSRAAGARFELKVRSDLEKEGWILDKWTNNIDLGEKELVKAKRKYNPFKKVLVIGTGFPDFIAFKPKGKSYEVIGVEVKGNGWLDKSEKEKCKFLVGKKIFSRVLIARKGKKRGEIKYDNFMEKYGKKIYK